MNRMSEFVLSTESTIDLDYETVKKRNLSVIYYHYYLDNECFVDDFGQSMPYAEFYQKMRDGVDTHTTQINQNEYVEYFAPILEQGKDILHVCFSSGLTGTVNSALLAQEELQKLYPQRKLVILDSLCASSGFGLLMNKIADLRDAGRSMDEICRWVNENRRSVYHWFFSTDLSFYVKGGRISHAAGYIGSLLHICPLLDVDPDGRLRPVEKVRTKKKAILRAVEEMVASAKDGADYAEDCFISHSDAPEDAQAVARLLETHFARLAGKIRIFSIGTTIGSNTGPGTVSLFFWGKQPRRA